MRQNKGVRKLQSWLGKRVWGSRILLLMDQKVGHLLSVRLVIWGTWTSTEQNLGN